MPLSTEYVMGRVAVTRQTVHVNDVPADEAYPGSTKAHQLGDWHTVLGAPLSMSAMLTSVMK